MGQKDLCREHQRINYRGNIILVKKRHTIKNTVVCDEKKRKDQSLTPEEKEENKTISSVRVVNEQVIGGIKRMWSTTDI